MKTIGRVAAWGAGIALFFYACANKGTLEGGPKDVTPPLVTKESPLSFSTNFAHKSVDIYFNEYVQLKDIQKKFVISPPQEKKPKVSLRAKYVRVTFQDSLRDSTTYSLDFADAIVDNNESNPLGYYRYVFSTGDVIDTMEIGGRVLDAETRLPVLGLTVLLYEDLADSAALVHLPSYLARTDSLGKFRATNIGARTYRVLAIEDGNTDNKYTPEQDKVAFVDTNVTAVVFPVTAIDTIRPDSVHLDSLLNSWRLLQDTLSLATLSPIDLTHLLDSVSHQWDTLVERHYYAFGPANLEMYLFTELPTKLIMTEKKRELRERIHFIYSIPDGAHAMRLRPLLNYQPVKKKADTTAVDSVPPTIPEKKGKKGAKEEPPVDTRTPEQITADSLAAVAAARRADSLLRLHRQARYDSIPSHDTWALAEPTPHGDTLYYWITDTTISTCDSLFFEVAYYRTDSTAQLSLAVDTVRLFYKEPEQPKDKKKEKTRKGKEEQADTSATNSIVKEIRYMNLKTNLGGTMDLNGKIRFEFEQPLLSLPKDTSLRLEVKVDSLWEPRSFTLIPDTNSTRIFTLTSAWEEEKDYRLTLDSAALHSIYQVPSEKLEKSFKTPRLDSYGRVIIQVTGAETPIILQLYVPGNEVKVARELIIQEDGNATFEYVKPGVYMMRAIVDKNGNGKWDTGDFLRRIQPEEILYHPVEMTLKENFDVEQPFDVSVKYEREDPVKKKKEEEARKKKEEEARKGGSSKR